MLKYDYDNNLLTIKETPNGDDMEFTIHILQEVPCLHQLKLVKEYFEDNRILTDALFYVHANHEYQIIVRKEYYVDFVLQLMKHHLLQKVEWSV